MELNQAIKLVKSGEFKELAIFDLWELTSVLEASNSTDAQIALQEVNGVYSQSYMKDENKNFGEIVKTNIKAIEALNYNPMSDVENKEVQRINKIFNNIEIENTPDADYVSHQDFKDFMIEVSDLEAQEVLLKNKNFAQLDKTEQKKAYNNAFFSSIQANLVTLVSNTFRPKNLQEANELSKEAMSGLVNANKKFKVTNTNAIAIINNAYKRTKTFADNLAKKTGISWLAQKVKAFDKKASEKFPTSWGLLKTFGTSYGAMVFGGPVGIAALSGYNLYKTTKAINKEAQANNKNFFQQVFSKPSTAISFSIAIAGTALTGYSAFSSGFNYGLIEKAFDGKAIEGVKTLGANLSTFNFDALKNTDFWKRTAVMSSGSLAVISEEVYGALNTKDKKERKARWKKVQAVALTSIAGIGLGATTNALMSEATVATNTDTNTDINTDTKQPATPEPVATTELNTERKFNFFDKFISGDNNNNSQEFKVVADNTQDTTQTTEPVATTELNTERKFSFFDKFISGDNNNNSQEFKIVADDVQNTNQTSDVVTTEASQDVSDFIKDTHRSYSADEFRDSHRIMNMWVEKDNLNSVISNLQEAGLTEAEAYRYAHNAAICGSQTTDSISQAAPSYEGEFDASRQTCGRTASNGYHTLWGGKALVDAGLTLDARNTLAGSVNFHTGEVIISQEAMTAFRDFDARLIDNGVIDTGALVNANASDCNHLSGNTRINEHGQSVLGSNGGNRFSSYATTDVKPTPVATPEPVIVPEKVVEPVVIPKPIINEPIVFPERLVIPEPIIIPDPVVAPEPIITPDPVVEPRANSGHYDNYEDLLRQVGIDPATETPLDSTELKDILNSNGGHSSDLNSLNSTENTQSNHYDSKQDLLEQMNIEPAEEEKPLTARQLRRMLRQSSR
ncbi:MAG: hypothetical protein R3Y43_02095 [Alphaproteobacteria bacterium]